MSDSQSDLLTLQQIAAWQIPDLRTTAGGVIAGIPRLQRGLVWRPSQVELLWDSLLRGFPVGSMVVCRKVASQVAADDESNVTHHLLDGQQRSNAITLGFDDLQPGASQRTRNTTDSMVWIDLDPQGRLRSSTREFLIRVTTKAHPWGYTGNDEAKRLSVSEIREAQKRGTSIEQHHPLIAGTPVPLSWLLRPAVDACGADDLRSRVMDRRSASKESPWADAALRHLQQNLPASHPTMLILKAVVQLRDARLVVYKVPEAVMHLEELGKADVEEVTAIEHLFTRLNQQGTRLDGEELRYSLIKAHWPLVSDAIDGIARRGHLRMPASHLVLLGVRAALSEKSLAVMPTLPALRKMAIPSESTHAPVRGFILDGGEGSRLSMSVGEVQTWLEGAGYGLPPVLISRIACGSPDLYLLMLIMADRIVSGRLRVDDHWGKAMAGLATLVHWFAKDGRKSVEAIVKSIHARLVGADGGNLTISDLREALQNAGEHLAAPLNPVRLADILAFGDSDAALEKWTWEDFHRLHPQVSWRYRGERELLLYAQRAYLAETFDYDPAIKDIWDGHNRPWDFDHIHASKYFYNRKSGKLAGFCREWGNTIGNLRTCSFGENRSDQESLLKDKQLPVDQYPAHLLNESDAAAFSHGDAARMEAAKARQLCEAIRDRTIRIYRSWYDGLDIGTLLPDKNPT
jgi:hypothetical protein